MSKIKGLLQDAESLFKDGTYDEALSIFEKAQQLSPLNAQITWGVIKCKLKLGYIDQSVQDFNDLVKKANSRQERPLRKEMAQLLLKERAYEHAEQVFSPLTSTKLDQEEIYMATKLSIASKGLHEAEQLIANGLNHDDKFFERLLSDPAIPEGKKEWLREKSDYFHELAAIKKAENAKLHLEQEEARRLTQEAKAQAKAEIIAAQKDANDFITKEKSILFKTILISGAITSGGAILFEIIDAFGLSDSTILNRSLLWLISFAFAGVYGYLKNNKTASWQTGLAYVGVLIIMHFLPNLIFDTQHYRSNLPYFFLITFVSPVSIGFTLGFVAIYTTERNVKASIWAGIGGVLGINFNAVLSHHVFQLSPEVPIIAYLASIILNTAILWGMILLFRTIGYQTYYQRILPNILNFKGKIGRLRFFLRSLTFTGFTILISLQISEATATDVSYYAQSDLGRFSFIAMSGIYYLSLLIGLTIIQAAQVVKRLRDAGQSPYLYFLGFIPIANIYLTYLVYFKDSED